MIADAFATIAEIETVGVASEMTAAIAVALAVTTAGTAGGIGAETERTATGVGEGTRGRNLVNVDARPLLLLANGRRRRSKRRRGGVLTVDLEAEAPVAAVSATQAQQVKGELQPAQAAVQARAEADAGAVIAENERAAPRRPAHLPTGHENDRPQTTEHKRNVHCLINMHLTLFTQTAVDPINLLTTHTSNQTDALFQSPATL